MGPLSITPRVWLIRLWAPPQRLARLSMILSESERNAAARFVFDRLRPPYIVSHAALRVLVARHTDLDPRSLRWEKGPFGKPRLLDTPLEFNLSHSGEWAMIAIGADAPLGVDIESIHPDRVNTSMIEAVASETERAAFATMSRHQKAAAFFRLWVRKEAVIKALGTGLSRALSTIDVPLEPEAPPDGIELRPPPDRDARWWLWDLAAPIGYAAALVVRQPKSEPPRPPAPVQLLTLDEIDPENCSPSGLIP